MFFFNLAFLKMIGTGHYFGGAMLAKLGLSDLGTSFRVSAGRHQSQSTANRIQDRPIVSCEIVFVLICRTGRTISWLTTCTKKHKSTKNWSSNFGLFENDVSVSYSFSCTL